MINSKQKGLNRRAVARGVALSILVAVLAGASIANSIANIAAQRIPDLALEFWSRHSAALAAKADSEWRRGREDEARRMAVESIRSTPLSSDGFQVLGLIEAADGNEAAAERLLRHASRLNQREVPAQTWLFQRELFAGDIETALHRIDSAMRVSTHARATLFPLLSGAMVADGLIEPIGKIFHKEPVWLQEYLRYAARNGVALRNLAKIVVALPEDSLARSTENEAALISAMARIGAYNEARAFLASIAPSRADGIVRDPTFAEVGRYAPFDWEYLDGVGIGASPARVAGLRYKAETGRGGSVVRQLISLDPGTYRLVTRGRTLSSNNDGGAVWRIRCASAAASDLVQLAVQSEPKEETKPGSQTFIVPASDCSGQWLELVIVATFSPGGMQGVVDMVQIQPALAA